MDVAAQLAVELSIKEEQIRVALDLFETHANIPFIARFRKELTGALDYDQLRSIRDRAAELRDLEGKKEKLIETLKNRGTLNEDLQTRIEQCRTRFEVEDIELAYKKRRRSRALQARKLGLEPLASMLFEQEEPCGQIEDIAYSFVDPARGISDVTAALAGASDIIAEQVAYDPKVRSWLRDFYLKEGSVRVVLRDKRGQRRNKYAAYADFSMPIHSMPPHVTLTLRRGERERALRVEINVPEEKIIGHLAAEIIQDSDSPYAPFLRRTLLQTFEKLLHPSFSAQVRAIKKQQADEHVIDLLCKNLRALLLSPPAGRKVVMGIDPGLRTGCKTAVIDADGRPVAHCTVYPTPPLNEIEEAKKILLPILYEHGVEVVAIGSGTGSREMDSFVAEMIQGLPEDAKKPEKIVVTEAGISAYASSAIARRELPDQPCGIREAVSLARRVQDPLAELVKVNPKEIAIGPHAPDVHQGMLVARLKETVEQCVHDVGIDVNNAPPAMLRRISGLTPPLAKNIVKFREENGGFRTREQLLNVPMMTPEAYQQCAGFLRIYNGENPLDAFAIHPEAYPLIEKIAKDFSLSVPDLIGNEKTLNAIRLDQYIDGSIGRQTLHDIITELRRRDADPRSECRRVRFLPETPDAVDLLRGSVLDGVVTNVLAFGAFVDIGMSEDGLVHISELADGFVQNPNDVVHVGQIVKVRVVGVDAERGRLSLSLRTRREPRPEASSRGRTKREPRKGSPAASADRPRPPRRPRSAAKEEKKVAGRRTKQTREAQPHQKKEQRPARETAKPATIADLLKKYGDPFTKHKE